MIFTDFVKKYCMESSSIFTKDDWFKADKLGFKDNGKTLNHIFKNINNTTLFFNKGFLSFTIEVVNNFEYNNERICYILFLYKDKKSPVDKYWDKTVQELIYLMKLNECTKILMETELKPEFWMTKKYGFKLKKYEMELNL